jgi:hypothetical protein
MTMTEPKSANATEQPKPPSLGLFVILLLLALAVTLIIIVLGDSGKTTSPLAQPASDGNCKGGCLSFANFRD